MYTFGLYQGITFSEGAQSLLCKPLKCEVQAACALAVDNATLTLLTVQNDNVPNILCFIVDNTHGSTALTNHKHSEIPGTHAITINKFIVRVESEISVYIYCTIRNMSGYICLCLHSTDISTNMSMNIIFQEKGVSE